MHHIFFKPIFLILFSALLAFTLFLLWIDSNSASNFRADLKHLLSDELIRINPARPGKTEYSPSLGRNLTNDEWSILKLKEFGVPKEHIEPIKIKEGFFRTFAEAKGISSLIKIRGYKSLLLVSTPYHTHRLKISFDNFLKNQNTSLLIQGSETKAFLRDLIIEFFKLKVYQYFLI